VWPEMELLVKKYVQSGDRVLDIGCGNGRLVKLLSEVDYLGIDGSKNLIIKALKYKNIKTKQKIEFKQIDMLALDNLEEKDFNIVFMFASFNHIPSEELRLKILDDIKNLLKLNGLLIMTNWNMWQVGVKKNIWNYKIRKLNIKVENENLDFKDIITTWQNGAGDKQGELYYRAFTKWELKRLFKKSGFRIVENFYSLDGIKSNWWQAKNVVTVGELIN